MLMTIFFLPADEYADRSIISSFFFPRFALTILVGGIGLAAMILLICTHAFGVLAALIAGIIIMFFEFVEVLVIGLFPGVTQFMQVFYFKLRTLICVVSVAILGIDRIQLKKRS
jgi:hypothetical protein